MKTDGRIREISCKRVTETITARPAEVTMLSSWFPIQPVCCVFSWLSQKWSEEWRAPFHPVYKSLNDVRGAALSFLPLPYPSPYLSLSLHPSLHAPLSCVMMTSANTSETTLIVDVKTSINANLMFLSSF